MQLNEHLQQKNGSKHYLVKSKIVLDVSLLLREGHIHIGIYIVNANSRVYLLQGMQNIFNSSCRPTAGMCSWCFVLWVGWKFRTHTHTRTHRTVWNGHCRAHSTLKSVSVCLHFVNVNFHFQRNLKLSVTMKSAKCGSEAKSLMCRKWVVSIFGVHFVYI